MSGVPAPAQVHAHETYQSFMRGWQDGCCARAQRREFIEHETRPDLKEEYEAGYEEGMRMRAETQAQVAARIGPRASRQAAETKGFVMTPYEVSEAVFVDDDKTEVCT